MNTSVSLQLSSIVYEKFRQNHTALCSAARRFTWQVLTSVVGVLVQFSHFSPVRVMWLGEPSDWRRCHTCALALLSFVSTLGKLSLEVGYTFMLIPGFFVGEGRKACRPLVFLIPTCFVREQKCLSERFRQLNPDIRKTDNLFCIPASSHGKRNPSIFALRCFCLYCPCYAGKKTDLSGKKQQVVPQ